MISIYRVFPWENRKHKIPGWLEHDVSVTGYFELYKFNKLVGSALVTRNNELTIYTVGKALTGRKIKLKI